jgi:cellulose biosynthesis protein BcsQ
VPIQAEQTSVRASELLFNQIKVVEAELKIAVHQLAIVPNLVQQSALAERILRAFRDSLGEAIPPFEFPKRIIFQEAYEQGKSLFTFQTRDHHKASDVLEMRQRYLRLAAFLHERGEAYAQRFDEA